MKEPSLDDLRVFLAVACEGSLNAAANRLSASAATLSRRINQLEQETGRTLFRRLPSGYELTDDGISLRERVLELDTIRAEVADWLVEPSQRTAVRLSAGSWTCGFLVENISSLHHADDDFDLVFVSTEERLSIAHREIDIGLRNGQPDEANLVARRVAEVRYASYASVGLALDCSAEQHWPWLSIVPECARTRSARWVVEQKLGQSELQATSTQTLLDMTIAGAGVTVLPCFVGDRLSALCQVGPIIDELTESQWLVMHGETRHRPAVRTVLERVGDLIGQNADLYSGSSGTG